MALRHTLGNQQRFRHRLKEINLEPDKSTYEIVVEIQVDCTGIHKLPTAKKGRVLHWTDLHLSCDVSENSTITVQITEVHPIRARNRTGKATYQISEVMNQNEVSIRTENGVFKAQIKFLDEEAASTF
ncbi:hypothetical protein FS749_004303 [Ceratobasidium sp. UAMH 11750]|nr:hypothetical protein FS749_004303 [Ceratobasidium sp. UAMH 11750]